MGKVPRETGISLDDEKIQNVQRKVLEIGGP
jgi:hypothetical protein